MNIVYKASVMRGASGEVRKKVQDIYPNEHFVHCYVQQLHFIIEHAVSGMGPVQCFFSELGGFSSFFRDPQKEQQFWMK